MHSVASEIIAECQVACMLVIIRVQLIKKSCQLHSGMSICSFAFTRLDGGTVVCFVVLNGSPAFQGQNGMADVEEGRTIFHDSGSSLAHHPSPDMHGALDPAAANCWDIDAADIVICKHQDGSDWLLNVSESGKVCLDKCCYQDSGVTSAAAMWLDSTGDLAVSADSQVYRAIRGGVQDVVVKVLTHSTNLARQDLRKVWFPVCSLPHSLTTVTAFPAMQRAKTGANNSCLQEVDVLKSVSYDRNVVQFYGTCPLGSQTMLVLEFMEVMLPALSPLPLCPAHVLHH